MPPLSGNLKVKGSMLLFLSEYIKCMVRVTGHILALAGDKMVFDKKNIRRL